MGLAGWRPGPVIVNLEGSGIWGKDSVPFSATGPPSSLDLAGNQHGVAARKIRGPPTVIFPVLQPRPMYWCPRNKAGLVS